jgi:hypothetical protein
MGLYVKPTKPAKQLHIKIKDTFRDEYKKIKNKKKRNKTKKLFKAPL